MGDLEKIVVKVKMLTPDADLPKPRHPRDNAIDIQAISVKNDIRYMEYGTGLALEIPEGYIGLIFPNDDISERDLMLKNGVEVIGPNCSDEIRLRFQKLGGKVYVKGDVIGRFMVFPYSKKLLLEVQKDL